MTNGAIIVFSAIGALVFGWLVEEVAKRWPRKWREPVDRKPWL